MAACRKEKDGCRWRRKARKKGNNMDGLARKGWIEKVNGKNCMEVVGASKTWI